MFLINIVTLFLEGKKKQAQTAVHGSQEVYLDYPCEGLSKF